MSFDALERSIHDGAPIECYAFDSIVGEVIRNTSADEPITLTGPGTGTYATGYIERGPIRESEEDTSGSVEVKVHPAHPVAAAFLVYPPALPIKLSIYRKHRDDAETVLIFSGRIARCTFEASDKSVVATLFAVPAGPRFVMNVPLLVWQSPCNWVLYGPGCRLDKEAFKTTATVDALDGVTISATEFGAKPDGWFRSGWAETTTGERRSIVSHVGEVITLIAPFQSLAAGATLYAFAGCDRLETTCDTKFDNLVNHLGFPDIPTRDPYRWSLDA